VLVQPDGKTLFGSNEMQGNVNGNPLALPLIRFNPDGTVDNTFFADNQASGSDSGIYYENEGWPEVHALGLLSDGKIVAAGVMQGVRTGTFANPGTFLQSNSIVRFNPDGTIDTTFQTAGTTPWPTGGLNYIEHVVIQPDDKTLALGGFGGFRNTFLGVTIIRYGIARLNVDGSVDTTVPQINGSNPIEILARDSHGRIYLGGAFTSINTGSGNVTRNRIAAFNADGSLITSFDPGTGLNAGAHRIRLDSQGRAWVVGSFITYRGVTVPRMIVLNAFSTDLAAPPADPFLPFVAPLPEGQRGETNDPDGDDIPNLLEFVFGSNPAGFTPMPAMPTSTALGSAISGSLDPAKTYRIVELETPKNTQGVAITLGVSQDLTFTDGATATEFGARTDNGTTETRRYYLTPAVDDASKLFWRIEGTR